MYTHCARMRVRVRVLVCVPAYLYVHMLNSIYMNILQVYQQVIDRASAAFPNPPPYLAHRSNLLINRVAFSSIPQAMQNVSVPHGNGVMKLPDPQV